MNNLNAAYEFINNMSEFGKLITDEVAQRADFEEAIQAKLIDSYFNGYTTKYTLKLRFKDFTVTINFKLNGESYELDFAKREGRKLIKRCNYSFCWAFDWDEVKDSVEAYEMLVKTVHELINNL